jgi:hypothetical protein
MHALLEFMHCVYVECIMIQQLMLVCAHRRRGLFGGLPDAKKKRKRSCSKCQLDGSDVAPTHSFKALCLLARQEKKACE